MTHKKLEAPSTRISTSTHKPLRLVKRKSRHIGIKPQPPRPRRSIEQRSTTTATTSSFTSSTTRPTVPTTSHKPPITSLSSTPSTPSQLTPIHQLLSTLIARNKNQHRTQPWWKHLNLLRKAISVLSELQTQLSHLHNSHSSTTTAAEVRLRFERESEIKRQQEVWIEWVRETLVPGCYVAFSQVVKDGQFANLGVVLMGVLAEISGVVGVPTVRVEVRKGKGNGKVKTVEGVSLRVTGPEKLRGGPVQRLYESDGDDFGVVVVEMGRDVEMQVDGEDEGVAVSRDEGVINVDAARSPKRRDAVEYTGHERESREGISSTPINIREDLNPSTTSSSTTRKERQGFVEGRQERKAMDRKKKKKKNAIDDLFAGLL